MIAAIYGETHSLSAVVVRVQDSMDALVGDAVDHLKDSNQHG